MDIKKGHKIGEKHDRSKGIVILNEVMSIECPREKRELWKTWGVRFWR
jgi:hypothetical protein